MFMLFRKHFKSIFLILSIVLITGCFGLSRKDEGVSKDYLAKQAKSEKAKQEIKVNDDRIIDKGKAFIHATKYTLNQETNRTPHVEVSKTFLDLAQLSIGLPAVKDAKLVEEISDGLISGYKAENLKLQLQNSTNKVEIDILKTELKKAESEAKSANSKLDSFQGEVIKLQLNEEKLKAKYQGELDKLNKENLDNAEKAKNWDAEHGFWQQFNIFSDIVSLIKKLFVMSIIGGVLFIAFKTLEVFFPAFSLVSGVFSVIIGVIKKIAPAALKMAGCVSTKVYDTLSQVVESNQSFMSTLKNMPIEDELIEKYPEDYKFDKKEVKELLLSLTDKTLAELQKELDKNLNEETRGVVSYVKAASGIKAEKPVTSLI